MADAKTKNLSFSEMINQGTPVLVDFHAEWCGPCKVMNPILKDLKRRMGDKINIIKVDVDNNSEAASKYNVRSVPTLILFQNGHRLWQQAGVMQTTQLESIIKEKAGL